MSLLEDDAALLLVAEARDDVVGYLVAHRHATLFANAPVVWVEEVMVDDAARRRGTGRLLMGVAEEAAAAGAAYVALATRRAAPFYEALGYDESATFFRKTLPPR